MKQSDPVKRVRSDSAELQELSQVEGLALHLKVS